MSRPPHKMTSDQTSGKGKVDYVLVRPPKVRVRVRVPVPVPVTIRVTVTVS